MYQAYWKLSARPFDGSVDGKCYYPGESQQAALLKLRYVVENRLGAALLAGEGGVGKTAVTHTLLRQLDAQFSPRAHLVFPDLNTDEFLTYLAWQLSPELGNSLPAADRVLRQWTNNATPAIQRIDQFLQQNSQLGRHAVLVVDEAHLLREPRILRTLRLLLNLEYERRPALSLVLVGQTALLTLVDRLPELNERLGARCMLRRFRAEETMAYVQHRLAAAGATKTIFADAALEKIHEVTLGVARQVNRLCDLALLVGYAEEWPVIGADQLAEIADELVSISTD
jgi:type II secretory pathway predicted ATPase ExeA